MVNAINEKHLLELVQFYETMKSSRNYSKAKAKCLIELTKDIGVDIMKELLEDEYNANIKLSDYPRSNKIIQQNLRL